MSEMSREQALEVMNILRFGTFEEVINTREIVNEALDMAIEALKEQRPHGEWKFNADYKNDDFQAPFFCSECGAGEDYTSKFCPNCGSDNRKEGEAE